MSGLSLRRISRDRALDGPVSGSPAIPNPFAIPVVAAFLASAGLPLYVHLPQFAAELGISLGAIGLLLLALRILDFVQDPIIGHFVDRFPGRRQILAVLAFAGMGTGFVAVFTLQLGISGLAASLVLVFTAYSLGTILFYSQGAELLRHGRTGVHYRLAGLRETGTLFGVVIAAVLPGLLSAPAAPLQGYAMFGLFLAVAAVLAWWASRRFWMPVTANAQHRLSIGRLVGAGGGRLLMIALLNALPVAVTSTLFLFFVSDRLELPGLAGLYLMLFFLSAGATAPLWSWLAARFGARRVLVPAMLMAIICFIGAAALPSGAQWEFAAIAIGSGAALGADMVILPALFAATITRAGLPAGTAFGLWSFAGKMALALAAAGVLPMLQLAGYQPGGPNSPAAISVLNVAYAIIPCILKLPAVFLVARLAEEPA